MGLIFYVVAKQMINEQKEKLKDEFLDYLHSEEGSKLIYSIGALIGNGAKAGIGIQSRGGKMTLQDLIMGIAANFIQGKMQGPTSTQNSGSQKSENLKFEY